MVTVIAKITAKKDKINEVEKLLQSLIAPTLMEIGCKQYDLYRSITDNNIFFFHEIWNHKKYLDIHLKTERFLKTTQEITPLLECPIEISLVNKIIN